MFYDGRPVASVSRKIKSGEADRRGLIFCLLFHQGKSKASKK
jgi:hypothetical protein